MTAALPPIHGNQRFVSASMLRDSMAAALLAIRNEDRLTFRDLGEALGRSEDQAAKYCDGTATMDAATFVRASHVWGGRFSNAVFSLIGQVVASADARAIDMKRGVIDVMRFLVELQVALTDGHLSDAELLAMRELIEAAGQLIDGLRQRLAKIAIS